MNDKLESKIPRLKKETEELFLKNRRHFNSFQYTVPSPATYPYQWLWDSCFHAIILSHINVSDAKLELISLVSRQHEDGFIPHMIYWEREDVTGMADIRWGMSGTSSITQPPMLAYAIWQIFKVSQDKKFLEEIYLSANKFYKYLIIQRDLRGRHLIGIINPDESGEDNSPRFDLSLGLPPVHSLAENTKKRRELVDKNFACNFEIKECMKNFFWVKDVPFNAILALNLDLMAKIADSLSKTDDKKYFEDQVGEIRFAMRKFMFEEGLYWSVYDLDYKKIKVLTWAIFAPLFAELPSDEEAENLVKTYLLSTEKFWSKFPVPTVAMDESSFNPNGFWRGPMWMSTNWFIYKGLINYKMYDVAQMIKEKSLSAIEKSGFREQFNPLTGEGEGAYDFTWGGLVVDMQPE